MAIDIPLLATEPVPPYQRIARDASHLRQLGLSVSAIAGDLHVDHKTAAKGIRWYENKR